MLARLLDNGKICKGAITGFFVVLLVSQAFCLPFESEITKGNRFYHKSKFKQAGELYSKATSKREIANYNLGNALYKQGRFAESERIFNTLINGKLKQKAYYNQGNSQFRQENYKAAINSYEQALKLDPKDKDAKYNLALAKKMLKMPKTKSQNQQNKQNQPKQQQNKDEQKQKVGQGKGMSKEDADRILQEIGTDERHKEKKIEGRGLGNGLDW